MHSKTFIVWTKVWTTFLVIFQAISPLFLALATTNVAPAIAEGITDNSVIETTVTPSLVPTVEPTIEPTIEPTVTPSVEPTIEPTVTAQPTPQIPLIECIEDPGFVVIDKTEWVVNTANGIAETKEPVKLGFTYAFPLNEKVQVTFKCLPTDAASLSTLKIQQFAANTLDLPEDVVVVGDYAYDITTDMTNGDFKYDLTLPKAEAVESEIVYIEKDLDVAKNTTLQDSDIKTIADTNIEQNNQSIKASNLEHFTIFLIVNPDDTVNNNDVDNEDNAWVSDNQYASFDNKDDYAVFGFPNIAVPPGSTIEGIEVYVEGKTSGRDLDVSIFNKSNGNSYTSSKTADLNSSETTIILGGTLDKWGRNWVASDFGSDFKVRVDANTGGNEAGLDMIQVKVYFNHPLSLPSLVNNPDDDYALSSVSSIWTSINGGTNHTGLNTEEVRWGSPAVSQQSGLRFDSTAAQSFNGTNPFLLGMLTHFNWPVYGGTAASSADLQITLNFARPNITPSPTFNYRFNINETSNTAGSCPSWQISSTPCDDMITFPNSYGENSFTIDDVLYTLHIDGFVNTYPDGTPINQFITEEQKNSSAFLVGHLSSVLVARPDITITKKTNNDDANTAPGPTINVGDTVTWTYIVQNTGNVDLTNIVVSDSEEGLVTCPATTLASGTSMTCTLSDIATQGQYSNTGSVTASYGSGSVNDSDDSHYYGRANGFLKVNKVTVPSNDQTNFNISISGSGAVVGDSTATISTSTSHTYEVAPGTYSVIETLPQDWNLDSNTCQNVIVGEAETKECTITNSLKFANLTFTKIVNNQYGGTLEANAFTLRVNGQEVNSGQSYSYPVNIPLTLSEDPIYGYTQGQWGGDCANGNVISLAPGDNKTCTLTNNDIEPKLTVTKVVVPANAASVSDFSLYIDSQPVTSGVQIGLQAGTYTVDELYNEDFVKSFSEDCSQNGSVTLNVGDVKECIITNTRKTGNIEVHKYIDHFATDEYGLDNHSAVNLGMKWMLEQTEYSFGTQINSLFTNIYSLSENEVANYHFTGWFDRNDSSKSCLNPSGNTLPISVELFENQTANIGICNQRDYGTLLVEKHVDDNSDLSLWSFRLNQGEWKPANELGKVDFGRQLTGGTYVIEEQGPAGYHYGSIGNSPECVANPALVGSALASITSGTTTTCHFNNQVNKGSITLVKNALPETGQEFAFEVKTPEVTFYPKLIDNGVDNQNTVLYSSLMPGEYSIEETIPSASWKLSSITCINDSQQTSGIIVGNKVTLSLNPGEHITCTYNNVKNGQITVSKFEDLNGDGNYGSVTEPLLSGWTFNLHPGSNCSNTALTSKVTVAGEAIFTDLTPGDYSISENTPAGWNVTTGSCRNIKVNAGEFKGLEFGNFELVTISGYKYEDKDKDGHKDGNESGLANWEIHLFKDNNTNPIITYTNSQGRYQFSNLEAGTYKIVEVPQTGWVPTSPSNGEYIVTVASGNNICRSFGNVSQATIIVDKITIPSGENKLFDFRLSKDGSTVDTFFLKDSSNPKNLTVQQGTYSLKESDTAGWSLTMVECRNQEQTLLNNKNLNVRPGDTIFCSFTNTKLGSVTIVKESRPLSSSDFNFTITGSLNKSFTLEDDGNEYDGQRSWKTYSDIFPGSMTITEGSNSQWKLIDLTCSSNQRSDFNSKSYSISFNLAAGENITCRFTNERYSSIEVFKFEDYFGEGVYGMFDNPISGWGMQLYQGKDCQSGNEIGAIQITMTNGKYEFKGLLNGWYSVKESSASGWTNISNTCQTTYLTAGDEDYLSFANFRLGSIDGYKYDDANKNGIKEDNEVYVEGWQIKLYKDCCHYETVYTDSNGYFNFSNLGPGVYKLVEEDRAGWDAINPSDGDYSFIMMHSNANKSFNFGNYSFGRIVLDKVTEPSGETESFSINVLRDGVELYDRTLTDTDSPSSRKVSTRYTYSITEDEKSGWELKNIYCISSNRNVIDPTGFNLEPNETVTCSVTNTKLGEITVVKYSDKNGNGFFDKDSEATLPDWGINLINTDNTLLNKVTDENGIVEFDNLEIGMHKLSEVQQEGWKLTGISCASNDLPSYDINATTIRPTPDLIDMQELDIFPGADYYCEIGNQQLGKVIVTKFNDVDGDGFKDETEAVLPDWEIKLSSDNEEDDSEFPESGTIEISSVSELTDFTDENGTVVFDNLAIVDYKLSEVQQPGWNLTKIYCDKEIVIEEPVLDRDFTTQAIKPIFKDVYDISLEAGDVYQCFIGNQTAKLNIEKTNDATAPLDLFDTVRFTIKITVPNDIDTEDYFEPAELHSSIVPAQLKDLMVTDIFSSGFKYVAGSYDVQINSSSISAIEPTYNSPGVWDLSKDTANNPILLNAGDVVELSYDAQMIEQLAPGIYKDIAMATAESETAMVVAEEGEDDYFVGTEVEVAMSLDPQDVQIQSRELPRTGSAIISLIATVSLIGLGFCLIILGVLNKWFNRNSIKYLALAVSIPMLLFIAAFAGAITANAAAQLELDVQNIGTEINSEWVISSNEFDVAFVTLDLVQPATITVECFYKGPADANYIAFPSAAINLASPGGAGVCPVTGSMTTFDGSYSFKVMATSTASGQATPKIVTVKVDRNKPLQPVYYQKELADTCTNKIEFTTANDAGRTELVEIFRSTTTNFIADATTRIATINIGSNQSGSYIDTVPVCGQTYYYVVQAVDAYGNRSPFRGDEIVLIITTPTPTTGSTTGNGTTGNGTTGDGSDVAGETTTDEQNDIEIKTDTDGANILGEDNTTDNTSGVFNSPVFTWVVIIGLAVIAVLAYALIRKKK